MLKDAFDPTVVVQVIIPRAPAAPLDFTITAHGADVLALATWFMLWEIDGRRCRRGRDSPAAPAQDREGEAVLTHRMKHPCQRLTCEALDYQSGGASLFNAGLGYRTADLTEGFDMLGKIRHCPAWPPRADGRYHSPTSLRRLAGG